jgi:hypothetical protein
MVSEFFRTSTVWVVDYLYEGRTRRWMKALRHGEEARHALQVELANLYGAHARLLDIRSATEEEETQYIHGDEPKNMYCPTGR